MIEPQTFLDSLRKQEIELFAGVPDSLLKEFLLLLTSSVEKSNHLICANEGNAIAVATGYHLATGRLPLVYMQNSGLGNAVNPLASLCHPHVYAIPLVLLIGWRGAPGESDEPQHMAMGKITPDLLRELQIDFEIMDAHCDVEKLTAKVAQRALERQGPAAMLCRKGTFAKAKLSVEQIKSELQLSREQAIEAVLNLCGESDVLVCTTGFTGREVFGQRQHGGQSHVRDFLNAGAMGHASQIALGMTLHQGAKTRRVVCLDGDGSVIMHMGSLAVIGSRRPDNLCHIVLNNGVHDSVGGQPTVALDIDLVTIARSCGYPVARRCTTLEDLQRNLSELLNGNVLSFLEVLIKPGGREDLPRPPQDFRKSKAEFMSELQS